MSAPRVGSLPQEVAYLRFPAGLKAQLRREAERSGRTLNAEVVRRLEKSLEEKT